VQFPHKKILVIENNQLDARATEIFLHNCGYKEVTLALSDEEALKAFSSSFDLILLDMEKTFPLKLELYKKLQLTNRTVPVIVYSNLSNEEITTCREAGIQAFLPKTALFKDFKRAIQRHLEIDNKKRQHGKELEFDIKNCLS